MPSFTSAKYRTLKKKKVFEFAKGFLNNAIGNLNNFIMKIAKINFLHNAKGNLKNKELLISNENAHLLVEKNALEKNLKKHSLFINALSWKKFNNGKKKSEHVPVKSKVRYLHSIK